MNQIVTTNADHHIPWNKGKLIGQKSPLKLKKIWAIRIYQVLNIYPLPGGVQKTYV